MAAEYPIGQDLQSHMGDIIEMILYWSAVFSIQFNKISGNLLLQLV